VHYRRRVVQAAFGLAVGAGMVAAGLILPHLFYLAVAGFAVILLCGIWVLSSWRHSSGVTLGGSRGGAGARRPGGAKRRRGSRRAAMMERMDERWRRRQEGR